MHTLAVTGIVRSTSHPGLRLVIAVGIAAAVLAPAGTAQAARVSIIVAPATSVRSHGAEGALGLFVPGAGATVTRRAALRSLLAGRSISPLAGESAGPPVVRLSSTPAAVTIYLSLPPPGRHHNVVRYPVAIVGGGYRGILTSKSTRIAGLVSIADIAPAAHALARGNVPVIGFRRAGAPADHAAALDRRLTRAHDSRGAATIALAALLATLTAAALLTRSSTIARAALLAAPSAIGVALLLSAGNVRSPALVGLGIAGGAGAAALAGGRSERLFAPLVVIFLAAFIVVLATSPETNALAAIGPHPDGGVRFYGVTNQVETLLLAPALAAASTSLRWLVAVGLLCLTAFGWSRAGADGGGVLVILAGLATLLLRTSRIAVTGRSVAIAVVAGGALAAALTAADMLAGGSSHVTRAFGGGPSTLGDDLWRRLHITWNGATSSWHAVLLCALGIAAVVLLATRSPHRPTVVAMTAALALSLVVNDSPVDELVWGALGCASLWALETAKARPTARSSARSALRTLPEPSLHRA
jgi:hypothetical protein